jgi:hypothetical protein
LFKKLSPTDAVAMRREKKFLMETLGNHFDWIGWRKRYFDFLKTLQKNNNLELPQVKEHIEKEWQVIAARKAKEEETKRLMAIEKRRAAAAGGGGGGGMSGLFAELKAKAGPADNAAPAIAASLPAMEEEIDFDDD